MSNWESASSSDVHLMSATVANRKEEFPSWVDYTRKSVIAQQIVGDQCVGVRSIVVGVHFVIVCHPYKVCVWVVIGLVAIILIVRQLRGTDTSISSGIRA